MDSHRLRDLKRGKLKPEARIDLHGMTAARAHDALIGFINRARADGLSPSSAMNRPMMSSCLLATVSQGDCCT